MSTALLNSLSAPSKTFTVPGKRWGSAKSFLAEFPSLKVSLFIATFPIAAPYYFEQRPTFNLQKQIAFHKNNIRYAISKELPIDFNFAIPIGYVSPYDSQQEFYHWFYQETPSPLFNGSTSIPGVRPGWGAYDITKEIRNADFYLTYLWYVDQDAFENHYTKIVNKNAKSIAIEYNTVLARREKVIDLWLSSLGYFEAHSSEVQVSFEEHYGLDFASMPAKSISYQVTNDLPPLEGVDWKSVTPWAKLFNTPEGTAILQAAAELYPVKVNTPAPFATQPGSIKVMETPDVIDYVFKYVFSDFRIEINPDLKILVKYDRRIINETVEIKKQKGLSWQKWVGYAIGAAILTVATAGLAAGVAAMGAGSVAAVTGATETAAVTTTTEAAASSGGFLSSVSSSLSSAWSSVESVTSSIYAKAASAVSTASDFFSGGSSGTAAVGESFTGQSLNISDYAGAANKSGGLLDSIASVAQTGQDLYSKGTSVASLFNTPSSPGNAAPRPATAQAGMISGGTGIFLFVVIAGTISYLAWGRK